MRNIENFLVIRKYDTHAETWHIVEDLNDTPPRSTMLVAGQNGKHYWIWHNFHHTNEHAERLFRELQDDWGLLWRVDL